MEQYFSTRADSIENTKSNRWKNLQNKFSAKYYFDDFPTAHLNRHRHPETFYMNFLTKKLKKVKIKIKYMIYNL